MARTFLGLAAAGLLCLAPGCCSMCQSPFDYAGPVQSGPVVSPNYVGRAGSVLTADNSVGLPPSPSPASEQTSVE
jgi:hypothetical protein